MGMWVGRGRKARVAYGFDDIALVPGTVTINPNEVDIAWELCGHRFELPIIAAAMDVVVGPRLAIEMGRLGGLAVLNLEGVFSRYANPEMVLDRIVSASQEEATKIIQGIYGEPIKEDLIHRRISEIKKGGSAVAVSSIPQRAERFAQIAQEAGADVFVVQSTVTTARHFATEYTPVDLRKLKKQLAIPLIIGNVVTYEACLELMDCGADALLIGVGPGAACTSREVLGLGVPQVTATADAAAARDYHYKQRGRYVPIITDGGMTTGGDVCKALAARAHATVGDDRDVASPLLVVIVARRCSVGRCGHLRHAEPQDLAARARGARAHANQERVGTAVHQLEARLIGDDVPDNERDRELLLQRAEVYRGVLGRSEEHTSELQ